MDTLHTVVLLLCSMLGNNQFAVRESATNQLALLNRLPYATLVDFRFVKDLEARRRVYYLLDMFNEPFVEDYPEDMD